MVSIYQYCSRTVSVRSARWSKYLDSLRILRVVCGNWLAQFVDIHLYIR